jgi:hypothetical protein
MKHALIVLAAATALVACGVDRDGTRDNVVEALEEAGIEVDSDCVDTVLDGYSDDQLEAIDEDESGTSPESQALFAELLTCVPATT